jgi:hypothetical protein
VKNEGVLGQKATPARTALLLIVVAIPAFFWFRFLYLTYVVIPNQVSPQMAKMRDAMMARTRKDSEKPRSAALTAKAHVSEKAAENSLNGEKGAPKNKL